MLLIGFIVPRSYRQSPTVPCSPRQSPAIPHAKMSYLAGPAVLHQDRRPEV